MAENVGGDGDAGAIVGARRQRAASPTRSTQSIDRVNREAPGWTKRLRLGSAPPDRAPCPSRMSALELSVRKYREQPDKSVIRPELGLSFDSLGEAYDFYNLYSVLLGDRVWNKIQQEPSKCWKNEMHARNRPWLLRKTRSREQQVVQMRVPSTNQTSACMS
ncbi:hypothetical protein VPH35_090645 [Triticum aestivum]